MKKILSAIIVFLGAVFIIHSIVFLMPGDPAQTIAGEYASASDIDAIRKELALDKGLITRYFIYIKQLSMFNLGTSIYSGQPVLKIILDRFPATLIIAFLSILIASFVGILAGIIAAVYKNSYIDASILWISSLAISTPVFVTCILFSLFFSYTLGIFPPSGKDGLNPLYMVLPSCALASRSIALIIRVVRNELLRVLDLQYITMARSLGFSSLKILFTFSLKNIIVPVLTIILLDFGAYLGGAVVTESVFAWPGIGRLLITALQKRDFPVMQGVIIFGTFLFVFIGILIDLFQKIISKKEWDQV